MGIASFSQPQPLPQPPLLPCQTLQAGNPPRGLIPHPYLHPIAEQGEVSELNALPWGSRWQSSTRTTAKLWDGIQD